MIEPRDDLTLGKLSLTYRVLFTGFLLVMGLGLLMAGAQIMLTHGMADGKPGLSMNDIVYSYYGNRSGSKMEAALTGKMKDKAPADVNFTLIKWVRDDAPVAEWDKVGPLLEKHCASCHDEESGLLEVAKLDVAKNLAEIDHGSSIATLTRVSHIHLFGIGFIFLFVGWIFGMAEFNQLWKLILIATPFAFLVLDIASWWLTKFWPGFAWLTMIGGIGYSLASTVMFATSLAQMWLPRWTQK
ncbi:elongation factor-1 alpha [Methylobacter svalbardensis]|uniref:elongation factor-1 alpha n=1 Tax=Methylobacter svalbardensis TaxID=3080016 RepID=UPI0030EB8344